MDLSKIATQIVMSKLTGSSSNASSDMVSSVLGSLLGGSNNQQGIDLGTLGNLVGNLKESGLGDIAESWLGNGENAHISRSQISDMLGADRVDQAAKQLGADQNDLLRGLQEMLPQVVDNTSKDGNLLDSVGGLGGLAKLAGQFLK